MHIDPARLPNAMPVLVIKLLCLLAESGRRHLNGTRLALLTGGSVVSVSDHLYKLEQRGIIQRKPHPTDRRQSLFTLTATGKELVGTWESTSTTHA